MNQPLPSMFDFQEEATLAPAVPVKRKRGRPKQSPLPQWTGASPTDEHRRADACLSSEARREALNRWVVQVTREPNQRDFTRAVLQMLAGEVDIDPASATYLQCEGVKRRDIADGLGVSEVCVSGVLRRLRDAKLISTKRIGRTVTLYTLHAPSLSSMP